MSRNYDRRFLERFALEAPAKVTILDSCAGSDNALTAHTRDISSKGAFLTVESGELVGRTVQVDISLVIGILPKLFNMTPEVRATGHGNVIRRERTGIAIKFDLDLVFSPAT